MIKAIETVYNGYRFRSRLEARWEVFFERLDIRHEYEYQGFDLDGIRYLPDFWLPDLECWIEIKGADPSHEEQEKALRLAQLSSHRVYMFIGGFTIPDPDKDIRPLSGNVYFPSHSSTQGVGQQSWCHCGGCGRWVIKQHTLAYDPRFRYKENGVIETHCPILAEYDLKAREHGMTPPRRHSVLWFEAPGLIEAYTAARQARFEHRS